MPRGGHMGLWKPTPRDIFKSRWKRFYKRCYRQRGLGNNVDRHGPHNQYIFLPDSVPSPWKLNYSKQNFAKGKLPPDLLRGADKTYSRNVETYMRPAQECREGSASDVILRCLDPGRRRYAAGHTGLGRLEANWGRGQGEQDADTKKESKNTRPAATASADGAPSHLLSVLKWEMEHSNGDQASTTLDRPCDLFQVRRLYQLCEEKEIVWDNGLNDPRRHDKDEGAGGRGYFPYIDEKAGLLDELMLKDILRLSHRTNSRRHPKWKELQFWFKRWHRQYLRRREMLKDEVKARMGVLKQGIE